MFLFNNRFFRCLLAAVYLQYLQAEIHLRPRKSVGERAAVRGEHYERSARLIGNVDVSTKKHASGNAARVEEDIPSPAKHRLSCFVNGRTRRLGGGQRRRANGHHIS